MKIVTVKLTCQSSRRSPLQKNAVHSTHNPAIKKVYGKTVVTDNSTRWNSTYYMVHQLLDVKVFANNILADMKVDSLTVAEWSNLEELKNLLEPFAAHTDLLQTDALSLSYVIPSILNLDCHLQQFTTAKLLTSAMRADRMLEHSATA